MNTATVFGAAPTFDVQPSGLSRTQVEDIAERLAIQVQYRVGGDLEEVVKKLNGRIDVQKSMDDLLRSGAIHVRGPGDFTIYLPFYTGRLRDRFTIAHELGHYVLHSRFGEEPIWVPRGGSNRTEWEANWFASAFLMPKKEFLKLVGQSLSDIEIAAAFEVSEAAVQVRRKVVRA